MINEFDSRTSRAWIETNLMSLEHNINVLRSHAPQDCEFIAVVKARAYGHGAVPVSLYLSSIGVHSFAVADIDEGIELRKAGVSGDVLILGYTDVRRAEELHRYSLRQTIVDADYGRALNAQNISITVELKIDTGMHRIGLDVTDYAAVDDMFAQKNLKIVGMFTHLSCAETLSQEDTDFTYNQTDSFFALANALKKNGKNPGKLHIQSSYGLLNYPDITCDCIRMGIAMYGVMSSYCDRTRVSVDLRPVLQLKCRISHLTNVMKGDSVGYDRKFISERDCRIATLPIGYADGYPRNLSCGVGRVLIGNKVCPVVGRICMDQLFVDITDAGTVCVGDVATLISSDARYYDELSAEAVAYKSQSISNELLSRLGARLPVVTVADKE